MIGIDPELVIPDTSKSIFDHAIVPWRSTTMIKYYNKLINSAYLFDFPIHKPYFELTKDNQDLLWKGNSHFTGINDFFKRIEKKNYKIQNRVLISRYRGKTSCTSCKGTRLKESTRFVKIHGKSLGDLLQVSIDSVHQFFSTIKLNDNDKEIAKRLLIEINNRLKFVREVGLGYLLSLIHI